jgi:hypothetical protein
MLICIRHICSVVVVCCLLFIDPLSNTNQTIWGRAVELFVVYERYTAWEKENSVCVTLKVLEE